MCEIKGYDDLSVEDKRQIQNLEGELGVKKVAALCHTTEWVVRQVWGRVTVKTQRGGKRVSAHPDKLTMPQMVKFPNRHQKGGTAPVCANPDCRHKFERCDFLIDGIGQVAYPKYCWRCRSLPKPGTLMDVFTREGVNLDDPTAQESRSGATDGSDTPPAENGA